MFDCLVASHPHVNSRHLLSGGGTSLTLHVLAVAGVLYVSSQEGSAGRAVRFDTTMVFITPTGHEPDKPESPKPVPVTSLTQLKGFQTIVAPTNIPTELPPIDLNERFDPRDYSGVGVEGGLATGMELPGLPGPADGQVYAVDLVTEQPERLAGPVPGFPPLLKQAGIQGRVMLEAVVDTLGRVEPGSIRIVSSPNPMFDAPSTAALRQTVFRPARVNGRAVRVLITMPFDFVIRG